MIMYKLEDVMKISFLPCIANKNLSLKYQNNENVSFTSSVNNHFPETPFALKDTISRHVNQADIGHVHSSVTFANYDFMVNLHVKNKEQAESLRHVLEKVGAPLKKIKISVK